MQTRLIALTFTLAAGLAGCSLGYRASGQIDGRDQALAGEAYLDMAGGGRFVLHSPDHDWVCEGFAEPPQTPAAANDCRGEAGTGELRCSDGRRMKIAWQALSCRAFAGQAVAPDGSTLRFTVRRRTD